MVSHLPLSSLSADMNYRRLGHTELHVSPIGIGGNIFGYACDQKQTATLLADAAEMGINLVDTADVYSEGRSEDYIGRALHDCREQWVIATKIGLRSHQSPVGLARRETIVERAEQSLKRLRTDYIDLYQLHHEDPTTPIGETLDAFDQLIRQGKIRHAGCSNFRPAAIRDSIRAAGEEDCRGFVSVQLAYNALKRNAEDELLPMCCKHDLGVLVYGALGRGVLTDKYISSQNTGVYAPRAQLSENVKTDLSPFLLDTVQRLHTYAREALGVAVQEMNLAWILTKDVITSLLLGARNSEQLRQNVSALEIELSDEHAATIDEIIGDLKAYDSLSLGVPGVT